jgi:hypothetical protein
LLSDSISWEEITVHSEHIEYKDEERMSDYQFKYIMDLKDENTALKKENEALRAEKGAVDSSGMTDYQFQKFNGLWDERNALRDENEALKKELEALKAKSNAE